MQTHFSADPRQSFGKEMGSTHPGLERSKRVLNSLFADAHHLGSLIQAVLHILQHAFMFPPPDAPLRAGRAGRAGRALRFQLAALAM